ncbi:Major facilitator superfamily [Lasiodiplodia theobromae]|nr:Major facilitator superfamily [Lasiodiplodia theobromae]
MLQYRSHAAFISATVSIAVFTDIFLYAVIVPVMPYTLTEKTGIDPEEIQRWNSILIAVYGASLLAFSPICGWFADNTTTRRLPLLSGLLALAASTVMLNIGGSIAVLVAGRLLQGASAAVVWVVGLALLVDTVGQTDVGQAMGYVSMAMSLAVLLAPLLGGVVLEHGGYDAVFAMAYALIGVDVVLRLVLVEKKVAKTWELEFEEVLVGSGSGTHTRAGSGATHCRCSAEDEDIELDEKGKKSCDTSHVLEKSAQETQQAVVCSCSNHQQEQQQQPADRQQRPVSTNSSIFRHRLPLRYRLPPTLSLLLSRRLSCSLWSTLVVSVLMSSLDAVIPLYVRETFHWTSTGAGLIFLPIVIPSFLAPVFGAVADRGSPRWPTAIGFLAACPCWVLLRLVDGNDLRQKALLCALLACLGLALAMIMPCVMAEITYVVAAKEERTPGLFGRKGAYAQAYGLFNMAWAGGALVGPIWAGYVKQHAGWGAMGWSLGLLAALSAVPAVLWTGGWVFSKQEPKDRGKTNQQSGVLKV